MATGSFRTTLFLAALSTAVIALAVAGLLFAQSMRRRTDERIEQTLVAETRLAAELLSRTVVAGDAPASALDDEADRMGRLLDARVTLIAPDGRVVGDSSETIEEVAAMENHAARPEVLAALATGLGRWRRHSDTLNIDMLYVAVPVRHPGIGIVRVALPLTSVRRELRPIAGLTVLALGLALVGAAAIAWVVSGRIGARVHDRRGGAALRRRRSAPAASRLRRRRAWRRGASVGRIGSGARAPSGRARSRPGADGGDPRRHDRRGHRRRSAGTARACEPGGTPDARPR
jgi:two-component system phosphate regulon sensor histidine kinase PhoR